LCVVLFENKKLNIPIINYTLASLISQSTCIKVQEFYGHYS